MNRIIKPINQALKHFLKNTFFRRTQVCRALLIRKQLTNFLAKFRLS